QKLQADGDRDQILLNPVVQRALDPAPVRESGGHQARPHRAQLRAVVHTALDTTRAGAPPPGPTRHAIDRLTPGEHGCQHARPAGPAVLASQPRVDARTSKADRQGGEMKRRVFLLTALALVGVGVFAAVTMGSPPVGVTPTILARGTYDPFNV